MMTKRLFILAALALIICCGCATTPDSGGRGHMDYDQRDEMDRVRN